jgi:hypothetical protein
MLFVFVIPGNSTNYHEPNRLIVDEQEPADFEWGHDRGENLGRAMLAYPVLLVNVMEIKL